MTLINQIKDLITRVENGDHWITIGAEDGKKGKHILVKDGETNKEATERKIAEWEGKETKSSKKDEDRHQKVIDLEEKAYKEFKTMYDNYIDKEGMEGWGGIPASRFDKAVKDFNNKYQKAFKELESDRFVSFDEFARRENKEPKKEEDIRLSESDWEYIAKQPKEKQEAIKKALEDKKRAEIEGQKAKEERIKKELEVKKEAERKRQEEITSKWNEAHKKSQEKAKSETLEDYLNRLGVKARRGPIYELHKYDWEQAQELKTQPERKKESSLPSNITESKDEHGRTVISYKGTNKKVKIHKNGDYFLASFGQELKDDDGYTEFQLFPSASGKSFKTEKGAKKWAIDQLKKHIENSLTDTFCEALAEVILEK